MEQQKVLMSPWEAEQTAWSWPNSSQAPNYLMNMHCWWNKGHRCLLVRSISCWLGQWSSNKNSLGQHCGRRGGLDLLYSLPTTRNCQWFWGRVSGCMEVVLLYHVHMKVSLFSDCCTVTVCSWSAAVKVLQWIRFSFFDFSLSFLVWRRVKGSGELLHWRQTVGLLHYTRYYFG